MTKLWRDCRSGDERAEAVAEALRTTPTVERAAAALGITRRYLTKMLAPGEAGRLRENMKTHETRENSENRENAENSVLSENQNGREPGTGENRTRDGSLTYAGSLPTFRAVSSVASNPDVETLTLSGMPTPLKAWLQEKALRRVQQKGGRFAVSPVVVEILEAQMERERREGQDR